MNISWCVTWPTVWRHKNIDPLWQEQKCIFYFKRFTLLNWHLAQRSHFFIQCYLSHESCLTGWFCFSFIYFSLSSRSCEDFSETEEDTEGQSEDQGPHENIKQNQPQHWQSHNKFKILIPLSVFSCNCSDTKNVFCLEFSSLNILLLEFYNLLCLINGNNSVFWKCKMVRSLVASLYVNQQNSHFFLLFMKIRNESPNE